MKFSKYCAIISCLCILMSFVGCGSLKPDNEYGVYIGANPEELEDKDLASIIVIDAQYFSAEEISSIQVDGHIVYTYLNIGSIENFRDYYSDFENITLGTYENWDDEQWVDVSKEKWQEFISAKADEFMDKGVDGFFIDNCDVYYQYPTDEIFTGLSNILKDLKGKGVYVLINGGDSYVTEYYNRYSSLDYILDGVNQESVYTCIDWDNDSFGVNTDEDREYFSDYLNMVLDDNKDAYVLEYANDSDVEEEAYNYASKMGYIPYISHSLELK